MAEPDTTSQPNMTTATTTSPTIPMTTIAPTSVLELTSATTGPSTADVAPSQQGSGSTSLPAPTTESGSDPIIQVSPEVSQMLSMMNTAMDTNFDLSGAAETSASTSTQRVNTTTTTSNSMGAISVPNQSLTPTPTPPMNEMAVTFLLISGKRRTMSFPPSTTLGRVKELVWNAWPADWSDDRPPTPSHLRILYLGKLLQDEDVLETALHSLYPTGSSGPTIVHISIRPVASSTLAADDLKKKKRLGSGVISIGRAGGANSDTEAEERDTHCCCVIC